MICPHCRQNVLRKERTGSTCGKCRRPFLFDPKVDPLQLHDLKLGKLATRVSADGRYHYTPTQLWYAAAGKTLAADLRRRNGAALIVIGFLAGGVLVLTGVHPLNVFLLVAGFLLVGMAVARLAMRVADVRWRPVSVRTPLAAFRTVLLSRWPHLYGAPPPMLVDDGSVRGAPQPPQPSLVLLCPDRTVVACLYANQVPQRLHLAVNVDPATVPPGVPVALLHDASVDGYRWAASVRATATGRAVLDIGPRPAAVLARKGAVRLRGGAPPADQLAALRAAGTLRPAEVDWLAKGWWAPVAALRPAALIARVTAAVERAPGGDPDRRAAAAVGFLSWPAA